MNSYRMKTQDLIDLTLDWAVAKARGMEFTFEEFPLHEMVNWHPSSDWAQGGPIIEREKISTVTSPDDENVWIGSIVEPDWKFNRTGPTPLIAAMRCYVASVLGDTIEIPEELK